MGKSVKNGTSQRFWQKWFKDKSAYQLEKWLESQGFFWSEKDYMGKYTLEYLQEMTFREIFGFEWCSVSTEYTGLPLVIYLDEIGKERQQADNSDHPKLPYQPNLMIENNYSGNHWDVVPISISPKPIILEQSLFIKISSNDIKKVKNFIIENYNLLMKHWNQKISTQDLTNALLKKYK